MKKFLALIVSVISVLTLVSCGSNFAWPTSHLGNIIPKLDKVSGEIKYDKSDSLYMTLENISENQYLEYIESCKGRGFTIDIKEVNNSFSAFNSDGYKVDVSHFSSNDMWITVDSPILMGNFNWPQSNIAKLLPVPSSNYGKIEWESETGFVIYVGNTKKSDYDNYVNSVYELGFNVGYNKGDDYFYAYNTNGFSVNIKYEGFNTMFVRIDKPKAVESSTTAPIDNNIPNATTPPNTNINSGNDKFNWNSAGKGAGLLVPEPTKEYKIYASMDYISVRIYSVEESDFFEYINSCQSNGFVGNIGHATKPDIYFMADHSSGYKLEVFFYEAEGYISIYAAPKSN